MAVSLFIYEIPNILVNETNNNFLRQTKYKGNIFVSDKFDNIFSV